ncbi:MAG: hypothetical protein ACXVLT_06330 [Flavisolibacter sp.]
MKKIYLFCIAIISFVASYGQGGYGAMTYSMGAPMADLKTYVDQTSFRGTNLEFFWHLKQNFDLGGEFGWNVFYKKEEQKTYTEGTRSISGIQYRYTNAVPMIFGARWRKLGKKAQPFLGAGIGTTYINRATDFGMYRITNNTWQLCARPEGGLIYKLNEGSAAIIGVKYYSNFKTNDLDAQSYLTLNIGFVWGLSHW